MKRTNLKKVQVKDFHEFNRLIDRAESMSTIIYGKFYQEKEKDQSLTNFSFCKFNSKHCELTTKYGLEGEKKACTFVFLRDLSDAHLKTGSAEYALFSKACGEYLKDYSDDPHLNQIYGKDEGKFTNKQAGIQCYSKKYNNIPNLHVYEYDLNSAYLSCIYNTIPDTRFPMYNKVLQEGEIGFLESDRLLLITEPGALVDVAFKMIETPKGLKDYCDRWYERKAQNKDKSLKLNAKHQIIDSIGYLQYHNPYLRAYIVEKCNFTILDLIDAHKDTWVLANTDAIFLTEKIDVDIGTEIGKFKMLEGNITLDGVNYSSKDFGDVHRGKQKNNYFNVINNRLEEIKDE